jgi:hypothetical protein
MVERTCSEPVEIAFHLYLSRTPLSKKISLPSARGSWKGFNARQPYTSIRTFVKPLGFDYS